MAVTGTVLVLAGLSQLLSAAVVWPSMVLLTAAGVWFFAMGWRVLSTPEGRGTAMPPNAVQCLIPTAALLWVLIQRFSIIPAASARLGCTFRVLGALGALLCVGMLCKLLYVPGGTYGCTVQQYGSLAFYFATCHELPQAIFELVRGSVSEQTLLTSLAMGCVGLCGLAAMLTTVPRSNPTKKIRQTEPILQQLLRAGGFLYAAAGTKGQNAAAANCAPLSNTTAPPLCRASACHSGSTPAGHRPAGRAAQRGNAALLPAPPARRRPRQGARLPGRRPAPAPGALEQGR